MKKLLISLAALIFLAFTHPANIRVLYNSLNPRSIPEHLAFYELYPQSEEGKEALNWAWQLISGKKRDAYESENLTTLSPSVVSSLIALVSRGSEAKIPLLPERALLVIDEAASHLSNRRLKGHVAKSESELASLPIEEIDLARGLFLAQLNDNSNSSWEECLSYEAMIDLMALQILTRISLDDPPEQKIREMNRFIFDEMGFRFPPHSLYAKDVDLYTFLPSVLDRRRGVCLGVSILYLCLAQRLNLPLEIVTPPGHIYVRYNDGKKVINIETTARGIHIDSEEYLGIDMPYLQMRNIKEVIGCAYFNEASVYLQKEQYEKSLACYLKAQKYLPQDALLTELMAYNNLFLGNIEEGTKLLKEALSMPEAELFCQESAARDFLAGKVDVEGIKTVFLPVDETRESIIKKRQEIEAVVKSHPEFCSGYFNLAVTWLQLHRHGEALEALEKYHALNKKDAKAEYYLTVLHATRLNYPKAWEHLHLLEKLLENQPTTKAFIELKREIASCSPE